MTGRWLQRSGVHRWRPDPTPPRPGYCICGHRNRRRRNRRRRNPGPALRVLRPLAVGMGIRTAVRENA